MAGLNFIPGFQLGYRRFNDITKKDYHLSSQFQWNNGHTIPKLKSIGIGRAPLDVDSIQFSKTLNVTGNNPTLTYGQAKDPPKPIVQPHFVTFDGKCLCFNGYTTETVNGSPVVICDFNASYRIRRVTVTYFLVDDTISVMEPVVENAGYKQGCILRRGKIPNPNRKNRFWHWSDFNNGAELSFYDVTYKLCNCNSYTKQFLSIQGVVMNPDEMVPDDPYLTIRRQQQLLLQTKASMMSSANCRSAEENKRKFKQVLEYDGKVLRFYAAWDDDVSIPAEWKFFVLLYFLADDRVEIYESKDTVNKYGHNPLPLFLRKIRLPKNRSNSPINFPSIYLEAGRKEFQEYYQPNDFIIGNTIFVMGRRFLIYDCDPFTRGYYKDILKNVQPDPIKVIEPKNDYPTEYKKVSPYTGFGDPEETRQNCLSLIPKPLKTLDFVTYVLNASKKLRFKLKMVPMYDVDIYRDFIMEFCLGNDHITIFEMVSENSGFVKGRFLSSIRLRKPGTSLDDNQFYGTKDLILGGELHAKGSVFKIVEVDLWSYKYMIQNMDMFTQDAIDKAKLYLETKNLI